MTQTSRFWNGLATGDATAAPYDADTEFAQVLAALAGLSGRANRVGVVRQGYYQSAAGELAVSGTSSPVSIAAGEAFIAGTWYANTAAVTQAIATPSVSTRYDVIGLRKDWTAQTVRVVYVAGAEGNTEANALALLTQSYGATWDAPLAVIQIDTGGVITVIDHREFVPAPGVLYERTLVASAATITITLATLLTGTPAYKQYELIIRGRSDDSAGDSSAIFLNFNGVGTASYNSTQDGFNASGGNVQVRNHGATEIRLGYMPQSDYNANCFGIGRWLMFLGAGQYKTIVGQCAWEDSASNVGGVIQMSGLYNSNSAVTTIELTTPGANFVAGTYVCLRGIPG